MIESLSKVIPDLEQQNHEIMVVIFSGSASVLLESQKVVSNKPMLKLQIFNEVFKF